MQETPRARQREVDGKPPRHTERDGEQISCFARQFLLKYMRMFRPGSLVIHSEHVEYALECIGGGRGADSRPNGTCIIDVNV